VADAGGTSVVLAGIVCATAGAEISSNRAINENEQIKLDATGKKQVLSFTGLLCVILTSPSLDYSQLLTHPSAYFDRLLQILSRVRGHRAHADPLLAWLNSRSYNAISIQSFIK
jgi:hypothetical protein